MYIILHREDKVILIFKTVSSVPQHVLLPSSNVKPNDVFTDEVDHSIRDSHTVQMDYRDEHVRLKSFKDWPVSYIQPERLAEAGFYYLGRNGAVKCFECDLQISNWLESEDPIIQHQILSATCQFVNNVPCGNVPIRQNYNPFSSSSTYQEVPYGNISRTQYYNPFPSSSTEPGTDQDVGQDVCGIVDDSHGTFTSNLKNAKYPDYCSFRDRLNTFYSWGRQWPFTNEQLAEAGFFYQGNDDQTLCFHCGVRLRNWKLNEDPWRRHALVQSFCHYLLSIKGKKFAEQCRQMTWDYLITKSIESQAPTVRKALVTTETQNQPGSSRTHENQSSQRETENISSNVAALSISTEEESEEGAACASNTRPPKLDKEDLPCACCYRNRRNMLFINCHHVVTCESCAKRLCTCPVCRQMIKESIKICIPRSLSNS